MVAAPAAPVHHAAAPTAAPARIVVTLPADANLKIDGNLMASNATRRVFESPKLEAGKAFSYTFQVEYQRDGKPVVATKNVRITAGAEVNVSFGEDTAVATR